MDLNESLQTHAELCTEIYDLMLEENRQLRSTGRLPAESLLNRKGVLLGTFSFSFDRLRAAIGQVFQPTPQVRASVQKAQQIILKALLLDRENEQLLLKCTVQSRPVPAPVRPALSQVQRAYGQAVAT